MRLAHLRARRERLSCDRRHELRRARAAVAALAALLSAGCAPARTAPAPAAVEVFLTTGDRSRLLAREPHLSFSAGATGSTIIDVDTTVVFQEIVGFGASLTDASAWLIQNRLSPAQREALLRELFGPEPGLGFSFTRVDMGASDFSRSHYSYDDVAAGETDFPLARFSIDADRAETIPILRRARAINPRLAIMASPWSAPAWMKTTGSMIRGTLRDDAFPAFADYFRRFVRAYEAEGLPVYAISIQNEPHYEPGDYPGMRLEPPARARFVGRHLGPLFEREGIATRILDWDHNWDEPGSPLHMLSDPVARRYVAGVAWHCYGGDVAAQSTVRNAHPDKEVFFTECSGGAWAPSFADNLAWTTQQLIVGATRHWARGVLMWNLALDERHGPHLGGCGNCRGVVTIDSRDSSIVRNEEYYAFGHASRFVRAGARRIASSTTPDVANVAFRNGDGSIVLVVVNAVDSPRAFTVRTGARGFPYSLPPKSVATFRWRAP